MEKSVSLINNLTSDNIYLTYDTVEQCPICKAKIRPVYLASSLNTPNTASVFNYCQNCHETFITQYKVRRKDDRSSYYHVTEVVYSEPNRFSKHIFDERIINLSPQFDKIYNQALAAEASMLDEIAGLGYRKALEFLIKDFAIHKHPDEEETIKAKPLAQCIKNYIENESITTLAERSSWIGNDEAHYIRKQEDRDVSDMKSFIQAIIYFIGMILITEDAASMTPKK